MPLQFRHKFSGHDTREFKSLFSVYRGKWSNFAKYLFHQSRDKDTYFRLNRIRAKLPRDFVLADVYDDLLAADEKAAALVSDVAVIFDRAPYDLRIFALAVFGVDYIENFSLESLSLSTEQDEDDLSSIPPLPVTEVTEEVVMETPVVVEPEVFTNENPSPSETSSDEEEEDEEEDEEDEE